MMPLEQMTGSILSALSKLVEPDDTEKYLGTWIATPEQLAPGTPDKWVRILACQNAIVEQIIFVHRKVF